MILKIQIHKCSDVSLCFSLLSLQWNSLLLLWNSQQKTILWIPEITSSLSVKPRVILYQRKHAQCYILCSATVSFLLSFFLSIFVPDSYAGHYLKKLLCICWNLRFYLFGLSGILYLVWLSLRMYHNPGLCHILSPLNSLSLALFSLIKVDSH